MCIRHLFISPGHNYFGHHEQPPGQHPVLERDEIECVAGQGIRGDRFFGYQEDYKGQITFFAGEVFATPPRTRPRGRAPIRHTPQRHHRGT